MFESSSSGVLASASGAFKCCWAFCRGFQGPLAETSVHLTPSSLLAQLFVKLRVSFSSILISSHSLHKQMFDLNVSSHRYTLFPGQNASSEYVPALYLAVRAVTSECHAVRAC